MSKALLVRNHSLSLRFANKPFEAFGDTAINWDAAKAIGEIASSDNVLTKQNHAVIKASGGLPSLATLNDSLG